MSTGSESSAIVLQPNLLQGIDYYVVNSSVWDYLSSLYGFDLALSLGTSIHATRRCRSPTQSVTQLDDEEIINEREPVHSPQIDSDSLSNHSESCQSTITVSSPKESPVPDSFAKMTPTSLSAIFPCIICGADSVIRCKQCNRCYYCSLHCYSIHNPYHRSECAQHTTSPSVPLSEAQIIHSTTDLSREGIVNTGNTCYLASSLQCLYSVAPLRRLLMSDQFLRYVAPTVPPPRVPHM